MFRKNVVPIVALFSAYLISCSSETNIIGYLITDSQKDQLHVQLGISRAAFDEADYDRAIEAGEKAWAIDPNNEEVAITLGFAYMGKAGIGPFDLAKNLIENPGAGESGASGVLSGLAPLLGVSTTDILKLGELDSETDPDIPLLIPYCASKARASWVNLEVLNKALVVVCPFVSEEVRLAEDYRHVCEKTSKVQAFQGKADFLWAFAHLTEAIAFDKVINYKTTNQDSTNLELRMDAIEGREVSSPDEITSFVAEVDSLKSAIDKILPVDGICEGENPQTQFQAMLNDLITTTLAFKVIPGIPEDFTASLEESMEDILALRDQASSGAGSSAGDAFKGDLTSVISDSLSTKIDDVNQTNNLSPEELSSVCASYAQISGGDTENAPAACSGL